MNTCTEGDLHAFAEANGIAVIRGQTTAVAGRVVIYDGRGHALQSRWALARALAHATSQGDAEVVAECLFGGRLAGAAKADQ